MVLILTDLKSSVINSICQISVSLTCYNLFLNRSLIMK
jgi:hypothetical protein